MCTSTCTTLDRVSDRIERALPYLIFFVNAHYFWGLYLRYIIITNVLYLIMFTFVTENS